MRIAIDGRELVGHATGVGRYISSLLLAWNEISDAQDCQYVVCAHAAPRLPPLPRLQVQTLVRAGGGGTAWEQLTLPRLVRESRPNVLFSPAYTSPLRCGVPVVQTIHDVSYHAHPEWFSWREGVRRRVLTTLSARRAARVLTISRFSKEEIVTHLGLDAAQVRVIYPASSGIAASGTSREPSGHRTVLFVGSVLARRHVDVVVEGFGILARGRPDVRLEIVGDPRGVPSVDLAGAVARSGCRDRIRVRGYVTDEELTTLYAQASAFAFLSAYEGFGLTPLDAIDAQVPPVVLDTPVAREVYGEAACYVARPDPTLVAAALERTLFDDDERQRLLGAGRAIAGRYDWGACARATLDALREVAT